MTVHYWLFVVVFNSTQVIGPFHGLLACEKAASQLQVVARADRTVCLSQKHANFSYKEPKK